MRLHHLEIQAFGPFAATTTVDVDRLSAAGLFLLSGATGSGKTSVLDAICFALYGDVPGDRSSAKRLRADQAAPGLTPRVSLEATLSGRRFRFVRSPQWERPKKRGAGTTTEQASVVVSEKMRGQWVTLSTRLDEAGHLVTSLVGMTMTQFTQVAMLPQGRFQTFLRARSEDRHRLLQQLFRTGRFEDVERWLRDHRLELRRRAAEAHHAVADVVSRASEAAECPLDPAWDLHDLSAPLVAGDVERWIAEQAHAAAQEAALAAEAVTAAAGLETSARRDHDAARILVERRARHRRALADHDALTAAAPAHASDLRALTDARRAAPVVPQVRAVDAATAALTKAAQHWSAAQTSLVLDEPVGDDREQLGAALAARRDAVATRAAAARAVLPRLRELGDLDEQVAALTTRSADLGAVIATLTGEAADLPAQVIAAEAAVARADAADRELLVLGPLREQAAGRRAARVLADTLTSELAVATAALAEAHDVSLTARETWLQARETRLDAMAAEIAGALAVGDSCPVCGSCDHPCKASDGAPLGAAEAEQEARRLLDDAQAAAYVHDGLVRDLTTRRSSALQSAGEGSLVELDAALAGLDQQVRAATAEARHLTERRATRATLIARGEALTTRRAGCELELATVTSRRDAVLDRAAAGRTDVAAALADSDHDDLADLVADLGAAQAALETAVRALGDLMRCEETLAEAVTCLAELLAEAGFEDREGACAAALPPERLRTLETRTADHQRRLVAAETLLAEFADDPRPDDAAPPPDLAALSAALDQAAAGAGRARGRAARASARADRLDQLAVVLAEAVAAWTPLADDLELATGLSAFAEGKAADNRLQMRLSAYVLAHRLGQVVAAANEQLAAMSDQRYALEHTARRGAGETRGGLSLLVRDDWSGESRDPATLSGGETFVVSLALALGLADVITQEAGGADLDTLFVDEGFGSLDADTLDDVMDVLDTLRDGGRVVGVVSHVAEMRDRIPTRLLVAKSRTGSTLTQVP